MTDITDEEPAVAEAGRDPLKEALDRVTAEMIEKLATFGGRVQSVLQGVMQRWNRRIQGLLNPGVLLCYSASCVQHDLRCTGMSCGNNPRMYQFLRFR